ncbi:MAG: outer membrane protein assembly factor BamD [Syntrophotaleaceae bacterium]
MKQVLLCLVPTLLLLPGCMSSNQAAPKTAQAYYQEGETLYSEGRYTEAIEVLEKAREIYETADLNMRAELKIADAHFEAENYVEAATAYEDFLKQHPGHPEAPRIMYQLGLSHYNQILAIDRDQTATRNAMVAFESLANLFPDHPLAEKTPSFIQFCQDQLAGHELYVGRFYWKTKENRAAIGRLRQILEDYPQFSEMDKVRFYLGKAYLAGGHPPLAVLQFEALLRDFPQSELAEDTQEILQEL